MVTLEAATEADQPGMGMTNRVIPAQGEERGASYSLTGLDGAASGKFQSRQEQFSFSARAAAAELKRLNLGEFYPKPPISRSTFVSIHQAPSYGHVRVCPTQMDYPVPIP